MNVHQLTMEIQQKVNGLIQFFFKKNHMLSYGGGIHLCFDNTGITQSKNLGTMIHSMHLP